MVKAAVVAEAVFMLPKEVAARLRVSERQVHVLLQRGDLAGLRVGRLWRIEPAALEAYLKFLRTPA